MNTQLVNPATTAPYVNQRQQIQEWLLRDFSDQLPVALTLTLKQHLSYMTNHGLLHVQLDKYLCAVIAERFIQKLNRQVFGRRQADKKAKSLSYLVVLEGGGRDSKRGKDFHLHLAMGGLPDGLDFWKLRPKVARAHSLVPELNQQIRTTPADEGWLLYLTKEIEFDDSATVLLPISKLQQ